MTTRSKLTLSIVLLLATTGCELVDSARFYGAEVAGRAVALECSLSLRERAENLAAVNGWLTANNVTGRAVALDCDGDGQADF